MALTVRILKWHQRNQSTVFFVHRHKDKLRRGCNFLHNCLLTPEGGGVVPRWDEPWRQMDGWIRGTAHLGVVYVGQKKTFSKPCTRFSRFPQLFISSQKTGSDQLRVVGKPGFLWGFCKVIFMPQNSLFVEINYVSLLLFEDMVVYFSASIWSEMFIKTFCREHINTGWVLIVVRSPSLAS